MDRTPPVADELPQSAFGILELWDQVAKQFGGSQGIVSKWHETYHSPTTPAAVKNQIILNTVNLAAKASALRSGIDDYARMTTDELIRDARELCRGKTDVPWPEPRKPEDAG